MNISATAKRWEHGWEILLDGEAVTQSTTLEKAADQLRDYLDTIDPEVDHSDWTLNIIPDLGQLSARVRDARVATAAAAQAQEEAARRSREVAQELRKAGLSVADSAVVLGVSRGRVSQLVA